MGRTAPTPAPPTAACTPCGQVFVLNREQRGRLRSGSSDRVDCSRSCAHCAMAVPSPRTPRVATCSRCEADFASSENKAARLRRDRWATVFCTTACLHAWRSVEQRARRARERSVPDPAACTTCGARFLPSRWQQKARQVDPGARLYCSMACVARAGRPRPRRKARPTLPCSRCGEPFTLSRQQEHFLRTGQTKQAFCSRACFNAPWPRLPLHDGRGSAGSDGE